ncbi:heme-degrading domain-containing protein [Streptomyces sp. NPDC048491]|uniref:heme-degrading domain-containing protein n=1 Tax=Streptomyces sp. NPDC048491 TaxID=3157207 RepID=UPI003416299F
MEADPAASLKANPVAFLEGEQQRLVLRQFTYEDAWNLGMLLRELAVARNAPVAIDVRHGTRQVFRCALPGSSADNDAWIDRKRRVAERYAAPSFLVGARFRAKGTTFEESSRLDPNSFAAHGGSYPVTVEGVGVVGTATVSGLPQAEDHALVAEALTRLVDGLGHPGGPVNSPGHRAD